MYYYWKKDVLLLKGLSALTIHVPIKLRQILDSKYDKFSFLKSSLCGTPKYIIY